MTKMLEHFRSEMRGYTVKALKTMKSHDGGVAYSATLYKGGSKIAEVIDDGWGGGIQTRYATKAAEQTLITDATEYGDGEGNPGLPEYVGCDIFIAHIVDMHESIKNIEKACKKKTVIRFVEDGLTEYRTLKIAFTPDVAKQVRAKFGAKLAEIVNEGV